MFAAIEIFLQWICEVGLNKIFLDERSLQTEFERCLERATITMYRKHGILLFELLTALPKEGLYLSTNQVSLSLFINEILGRDISTKEMEVLLKYIAMEVAKRKRLSQYVSIMNQNIIKKQNNILRRELQENSNEVKKLRQYIEDEFDEFEKNEEHNTQMMNLLKMQYRGHLKTDNAIYMDTGPSISNEILGNKISEIFSNKIIIIYNDSVSKRRALAGKHLRGMDPHKVHIYYFDTSGISCKLVLVNIAGKGTMEIVNDMLVFSLNKTGRYVFSEGRLI